MRNPAEIERGIMADLAEIPAVKRGLVWCRTCGREERAGVECFKTGWPKCCDQTMTLDPKD